MSETLFVQFYSKIENTNPNFKGYSIYELCNGFSDTYDLCKNKGDFYWVNSSKQLKGFGKNKVKDTNFNLPINQGIVYVSVYYLSQLYQVYLWALQYPNINFIAGGPAVNQNIFELKIKLPKNINLIESTVEEYFGVTNFSYDWNLELPDNDYSMILSYTYTLSSRCYWGKCIFCNYSQGKRNRPDICFNFLDVPYLGRQRINLYTPSMTSKQLNNILYTLPYDDKVRYDIYLRGNKMERETLKQIFANRTSKFPQVKFIIGVEFPTNRMLKYINKNVNVDGIIKTINLIADNARNYIQIQLPFILGWNNLEKNDIVDLKKFFKQLPYDKIRITFSANMLTAKLNTPVYDTYERKKELYIGPFYYGFMPLISNEQLQLSKDAIELMFDQNVTVFDYHNIRNM